MALILQAHGDATRETLQAHIGAERLGVESRWSREPRSRWNCHVGSVEWCEKALGYHPMPDYYPAFLKPWLKREVREIWDRDVIADGPIFAKPYRRYKEAAAGVFGAGDTIPAGWVCSEVVHFENEWRYYVANGEVLAACWYDGVGGEVAPPRLRIGWPGWFCGAVDFGACERGIVLVESHHPYACGWYGDNDECEAYVMWLLYGWDSLL